VRLANRRRTRMPTGCSVCCRAGIASGFVRILQTGSAGVQGNPSTVRTSASKFVLFHRDWVGSLVNTMVNGQAAEVGTIGNEGMVGLPLVLGDDNGAHQCLRPGSRCRPENEGGAVQAGTGAPAPRCGGNAPLCSRGLQPGRAVRRVQSLSCNTAAGLPVADDDARPHAIG